MAAQGEKTEEATPRRLADARRRGQVVISRDLSAALGLAAFVVVLASAGPAWFGGLLAYMRAALVAGARSDEGIVATFVPALGAMATAVALPLGVLIVVVALVGLVQTRWLFSAEAATPDLSRAAPSLDRVFGAAALVELGRSLLKVGVVGVVAWTVLRPLPGDLARMVGAPLPRAASATGRLLVDLLGWLGAAAVAWGVLDYGWRWRSHRKGLRMSRDEVKREHRDSEGDPKHKAERDRLHRELLQQRRLADVRKADFVVVNPDHIAVAVRYDQEGDAPPFVIARGERLMAEAIKQVAREAGVPIFRDVTLARSLNDIPEEEPIPEALFQAVAEILRVVYGMTTPARSDGQGPPPGPQAGWRRA